MGHEVIIWNLCSNRSHILLCSFKFFYVFLSPLVVTASFQWLLRLLYSLRNQIILIVTTVYKVGMNGFCRGKGQEVSLKIF